MIRMVRGPKHVTCRMAEGTAIYSPNKRELDKDVRTAFKHFKSYRTKQQAHSARTEGTEKRFRVGFLKHNYLKSNPTPRCYAPMN